MDVDNAKNNDVKNIYESFILQANAELIKLNKYKGNKQFKDKKNEYKNKLANSLVKKVNSMKSEIFERNRAYLEVIEKKLKADNNKKVIKVTAITHTRVLVNTSSPFAWLIDEVGMDWDPILDTPIIPASQIKGVLSTAFSFLNINECTSNLTLCNDILESIRNILFGSSKEGLMWKSAIDVTDAYPISGDTLVERDVITPTYGRYIKDQTGATKRTFREHEAKPTPVQFITIAPNVKFKFLLILNSEIIESAKKIIERKLNENKTQRQKTQLEISKKVISRLLNENILIDEIKLIVKKAFEEIGIGAKTSSGYGLFEVISFEEVN